MLFSAEIADGCSNASQSFPVPETAEGISMSLKWLFLGRELDSPRNTEQAQSVGFTGPAAAQLRGPAEPGLIGRGRATAPFSC